MRNHIGAGNMKVLKEATSGDREILDYLEDGSYDLNAMPIQDLIRLYRLAWTVHGYDNAVQQLENEFKRRGNKPYIVPHGILFNPNATYFRKDLANAVKAYNGTLTPILTICKDKYNNPSYGIVAAYVIALAAGKSDVAKELKDVIIIIGTYDMLMPNFLKLCSGEPRIVNHISSII